MIGYFKIFPSRIFSAILFFVGLLVASAIYNIPVAVLAKIVIAALSICALAFYICHDALLLLPSSVVGIRVQGGDISVRTRGGREFTGGILGDSVVTSILTILNVLPHDAKKVHGIVLFPDSMDPEEFRKLRVSLKWED